MLQNINNIIKKVDNLDFIQDILKRKDKIAEEKAKRFSAGNKSRVDTNIIKEQVLKATPEKVMDAVINAGIKNDIVAV